MLPRSFALRILGPLALATLSGHAAAGGAWLPGSAQTAVEHRVAVALGPERTTLWTSVRFEGGAGPVGVVVPVPPLAALDLSSDAWLEALEVATAPRVFPPEGISPYCPGEQGEPEPLHVAGDIGHTPTLPPAEILVLDDAGAVALWAAQHGLSLSPEIAAGLSGMQGKRFLAARFVSPGGAGLTRTLRVVLPAAEPALPLALTRAGNDDVRVTAWLIGPGRAGLSPSTLVTVPEESLIWSAGALDSNYEDERMAALVDAGPEGAVLECSSHEALKESVPLGGSASIDGVITSYFERAVAYGEGSGDPAACAVAAAAALSSGAAVSGSCPRADQGVVDGADTCVEAPLVGETDPARLRCGEGADDLAVGLSGLIPSGAVLTRYTLRVPAQGGGLNHAIG
ncbi:MAG TPA: DUF2330 domain-containing protein, partial [Candidatus Nanopelagicales bacterium]|nr:DUF2330 domain-containing protein [Candidatus Nanopelagicales bacterium]